MCPHAIGATARLVLAIAAAIEVLALEILYDARRQRVPGSHGLGPASTARPGPTPPPSPPPHNAARRPGASEARAKPLGHPQARRGRAPGGLTPPAPS